MTDDMVYLNMPVFGTSGREIVRAIRLFTGFVNRCPCVVDGDIFAPRTLMVAGGRWFGCLGVMKFAHYKDKLGFVRKRYPSVDFSGIPGVVCNNN